MENILFKELQNYVLKSNESSINVERIQDFQCERLFQDYLNRYAPYLSEKIERYNQEQFIKNQLFSTEIVELANAFLDQGLTLIHLKGMSLLNEMYPEDVEAFKKRKINDIDILVPFSELRMALDLLGEMGYYVSSTKEKVSSKIVDKFLSAVEERGIHLPEFFKKKQLDGDNYIIKMDCHVSILHFLENKKIHMEKLIKRSEIQAFNGTSIRVLELHDRILHLITHFTKENFRCDIRWYLTGERQQRRNYRVRLSLLHEIAIIVKKNRENLNIETLMKRAECFGCQDEVKLVLNLIQKVYPSLCEDYQFEIDIEKPFFVKKYLGMFYPLEFILNTKIDILESTFSEKASAIMQSVIQDEMIYLGKNYHLAIDKSQTLVDKCIIAENIENVIGDIEFFLNEQSFVIELKGENFIKVNQLFFTIGSVCRSEVLAGYVNKFSLDIFGVSKRCYKDCILHNGYVDLKLKGNALVDTNKQTVKVIFPRELLHIEKGQKVLMIDIGIPSVFSTNSNKMKIYSINDIGGRGLGDTFYFSPKLLQTVCLATE